MKDTFVILLLGALISCSFSSNSIQSQGTESIYTDSLDDTVNKDSTFLLWTSIIDSMKKVELRDVFDYMEPHDMFGAIESCGNLNGEKRIRDLYPHYQIGDTLVFIQRIRGHLSSLHSFFWKKNCVGYYYMYRKNLYDTDSVFVRHFDEREDQQKELFKACEEWNLKYLSKYNEYHHHKSQMFIFRVIVLKDNQFQMDYISRIFQAEQ